MRKVLITIGILLTVIFLFLYLLISPLLFLIDKDADIQVDKDSLIKHVETLTSIKYPRNYSNINSLNKIAAYISNEFKKLNCDVKYQTFEVNWKEYKNVICSFTPEKKEKVIIWAHYDVAWNLPWADDNASWVAWLLEIARITNESNLDDIDYWIEFVAYTLEEMPYFRTENMWSAIHGKSLKDSNTKVKLMISLEMIGFFTEADNSQKYPLKQMSLYYPNKWNFIAVVWKFGQSLITKKVKKYIQQVSNVPAYSLNWFSFIKWIDNSDHRNYWNHWYNAVMITDTSFYRNPNYHKASDTINTLDFDKMSEVVKWVYWAIINM